VSLVVLLSSSSFFLNPYLSKSIAEGRVSESQFAFALNKKNISALASTVKQHDVGSVDWLSVMVYLAHQQGSSAYLLAKWYEKKISSSDFEFKLGLDNQTEAIKWYKQSIRLHFEKAKTSLARLYMKQGLLQQAELLLEEVNYNDEESVKIEYLIVKITLAIEIGDEDIVSSLLKTHSEFIVKYLAGRKLLELIYRYKVTDVTINISSFNKTWLNRKNVSTTNENTSTNNGNNGVQHIAAYHNSCISSIQLFASTLNDLVHIEKLQKKILLTPLAKYVCLPLPRYFPKKLLNCSDDLTRPIICDEAIWQKVAATTSTRHIGYMNSQGGANVHLGILYFDRVDDLDVFTHELTHLLGFVDEYPISKSHITCQSIQKFPFSHNISILANTELGSRQEVRQKILAQLSWADAIKPTTPILIKSNNKGWELGTPASYNGEVGMFKAKTCNDSVKASEEGFSAYKGVSKNTHLEYYAELIPKHYLDQLKKKPRSFLMPSFHYNIALNLYKKGNIIGAKHWLKQSSMWEKDKTRKNKILRGEL
jgi:hypothetical protein